MNRMVISGLSAALFLTACGGGGGSSSDGGGQPQSGDPFSVTTLTSNACGLESPLANAQIVFHRDNGSILAIQRTGSDGGLNTGWPDGARHVSVIGVAYNGVDTEVRTYIDWNSGDLGRERFFTNITAGCDCGSLELDKSELDITYWDHTLMAGLQRSGGKSFTSLNVLEYCVEPGATLELDLVLTSDRDLAPYANVVNLASPIPTRYSVPAALFADAANQGAALDVATQDTYGYGYSYADSDTGLRHLQFQNDYSDTAYYFPALSDRNLFMAIENNQVDDNEFGQVFYLRGHRDLIENGIARVDLPDSEVQFSDEAMRALLAMAEEGNTAGYDFTGMTEGANQLMVDLGDRYSEHNWRIYAPLKGDQPSLDLPSEVLRDFDNIVAPSLRISTYGFGHELSLDEYRRQEIEQIANGAADPTFFDDYVIQRLDIRSY